MPELFKDIQIAQLDLIKKYGYEDKMMRNIWDNLLKQMIRTLDSISTKYIVVKFLRGAPSLMQDLDIMINDLNIVAKITHLLRTRGFYEYRPKYLFSNPHKIGLCKENIPFQIDFYLDCLWRRRRICNIDHLISSKIVEKYNDINVPVPRPEYDLYIVGVHGYHNMKITLAEIMQGIYILDAYSKKFDPVLLWEVSKVYNTIDASYFYLKSIKEFIKFATKILRIDISRIEENLDPILDIFEEKYLICRKIRSYLESLYLKAYKKYIVFPVKVPLSIFRILTPFNFVKGIVLGKSINKNVPLEFLSYYVTLHRDIIFKLRQVS